MNLFQKSMRKLNRIQHLMINYLWFLRRMFKFNVALLDRVTYRLRPD